VLQNSQVRRDEGPLHNYLTAHCLCPVHQETITFYLGPDKEWLALIYSAEAEVNSPQPFQREAKDMYVTFRVMHQGPSAQGMRTSMVRGLSPLPCCQR